LDAVLLKRVTRDQPRSGRGVRVGLAVACVTWLVPSVLLGQTTNAFGPETFVRRTDAPVVEQRSFSVPSPATSYTLRIRNSGVSSAVVTLNGVEVVGPSAFNANVKLIEVPVTLAAANTLSVELRSAPGSFFVLEIEGASVTDTQPPLVQIAPSTGTTVNTTTPLIEISWSDEGSGVDTSTFSASIDGIDYTSLFTLTPFGAAYITPLSGGQHVVIARVKDRAGNAALATSQFLISAFNALPQATPTGGPVPLTVTFTTRAEYTDGAIIRYRWDFQGDGIYDTNDPGARNYTFTYTQKGSFKATLEVLNDKGQTATAALVITVTGRPPVPTASVNPSNGAVPLQVVLSGTATDPDGMITLYEWDFEGDGVFDFTSTTTGNTTHTYGQPGTFNAVFRVTDNDGLTATAAATATAVRGGPPGSPTATITTPNAPRTIVAPSTVGFNGTGTDPDGSIVNYEWDFNGDGVYEYASASSASTSFQYTSPGTFTAALRVTDNSGLTGIDTVDITVNIAATLSIPGDNTCRPQQGGNVTIRTTLGGTTRVTLIMKDRGGQTVRTLVNGVERTAGTYSDVWDCMDTSGAIVREGVYHAVLQYVAGGEVRSVDLTNTTGGQLQGWSYVMEGGSCFTCPFKPLEDDLLDVDFTIPKASEMSLSIRLFFRIDEVVSVFDRRLYGTGTHRIQWDGANVQGRLVAPPPGEQFLFGLTRFTLPDNAIFVEGRPTITAVAADPNYFDPGTGDFISSGPPTTTLSFEISKPATVVLQVFNTTTNRLVRTLSKVVGTAGADMLAWDGRTDAGLLADSGDYRLALRAVESSGTQSIVHYARVRVFY
jgi:flagellar hook assembly protein FlgD